MARSSAAIDLPTATALLRADLPQFAHLAVTLLGEGTDHLALDLGGHYVFRFPKRPDTAAALQSEARLTGWLAPVFPLAIPRYEFVRRLGQDPAHSYAGYAKLPGTPALFREAQHTPFAVVGPPLGTFLRRLHDMRVEEARALGVPVEDDPGLDEWAQEALSDLALAVERGEVSTDAGRQWEHLLMTPPSPETVAPCLIHGDLAAEHVLLDEQGTPTAVIDWSDAEVGDPARDLAGVLHWGGDGLLHLVLETYGRVDERTLERARWLAVCRALGDLTYGAENGLDAYVRAGKRALGWLSPP
ncbi:phosphotransferase [Deinococcus aestuarii]|uniref:phosphotransferase n=1 Tax=Deinococcus aestuarii TaxID=2774531 RepID=UPI001C0B550D|nr:phosphotransferase [Deinococcus aestuarii]